MHVNPKFMRIKIDKALLGLIMSFAYSNAITQNLVPNPSFELPDSCPSNAGFINFSRPLHWKTWRSSPDYFHSCAGLGQAMSPYSVPYNGVAFQYAQDGDGYVGLVAYSEFDEYREYVGAQLLDPLIVGHVYQVSFWLNLAFAGQNVITTSSCNKIGLLFTNMDDTQFAGPGPLIFRNEAHVLTDTPIMDTTAWIRIEGVFLADSSYQYVVLGNFFENSLTEHQPLIPSSQEVAYLLVDNINISDLSTSVNESWLDLAQYFTFDQEAGVLRFSMPNCSRVQILNLSGQLIWEGLSASGEFQLDTQRWHSGVYIGKLQIGIHSACVKILVP